MAQMGTYKKWAGIDCDGEIVRDMEGAFAIFSTKKKACRWRDEGNANFRVARIKISEVRRPRGRRAGACAGGLDE